MWLQCNDVMQSQSLSQMKHKNNPLSHDQNHQTSWIRKSVWGRQSACIIHTLLCLARRMWHNGISTGISHQLRKTQQVINPHFCKLLLRQPFSVTFSGTLFHLSMLVMDYCRKKLNRGIIVTVKRLEAQNNSFLCSTVLCCSRAKSCY